MTATRPHAPTATTPPLLRTYDVTVSTVTPVHIGSGVKLLRDYDFVAEGDEYAVLDLEAIYNRLFDLVPDAEWQTVANLPISRAINDISRAINDPGARDLTRYRLKIAHDADAEGFEDVHAFIRDGFNRAYLPGSSLKGAIRTAFAVAFATEKGQPWVDRHLGVVVDKPPRREFAAQQFDREVFGPTPQTDVLRALRPSDLFADNARESAPLELVETRVTKRRGDSTATIMVEAIPSGTKLHGTLTVDADPLAHLQHDQREMWGIPAASNDLKLSWFLRSQAKALIDHEKRYYASGDPQITAAITAEYVGLERQLSACAANEALVWLGWGTGWHAKTYGDHLTQSAAFDNLRNRYGLGSRSDFPTTRRLVYANNRPVRPMGWVRLTLTEGRSR